MPTIPKFNADQLKELQSYGVIQSQVERLEMALHFIRAMLQPPAANNDVIAILDDVAELSETLACKLASISQQIDPAHANCYVRLEERYWDEPKIEDDGVSVAQVFLARLKTLSKVAKSARELVPTEAARHHAASLVPIGWIYNALLEGWVNTRITVDNANGIRIVAPYPTKFHISGRGSKFNEIARICYALIGRSLSDRAIRAFRQNEGVARAKRIAAIEKGIESEARSRRRSAKSH